MKRQKAERGGRRAERLAAWWLRLKGWRILDRRVRTPVGEVDLIVRRGKVTVFVEVKQRSFSRQEGDALAAVNRRRILRAAQYWLIRHPDLANEGLRFDVIFLAPFAWPRHLKNAFDGTGL